MILYMQNDLGTFIGYGESSNLSLLHQVVSVQWLPVPAQGRLGQTGIMMLSAMTYVNHTVEFHHQGRSMFWFELEDNHPLMKQYKATIDEAAKLKSKLSS